jgi:predicted hydrocarbon binding protein
MERREFLGSVGKCGVAVSLLSVLGLPAVSQDKEKDGKKDKNETDHSCDERMEFAEGWVGRFMVVLDANLDEQTRCKIMEANGKSCACAYIESAKLEYRKKNFDEWIKKAKDSQDGSLIVKDGYIIHTYMQNYRGFEAAEGSCLCPFVETKPVGLSGTYCHCSVGYIKEIWGRIFGEPMNVELLESTLRGGKRCRFKIWPAR